MAKRTLNLVRKTAQPNKNSEATNVATSTSANNTSSHDADETASIPSISQSTLTSHQADPSTHNHQSNLPSNVSTYSTTSNVTAGTQIHPIPTTQTATTTTTSTTGSSTSTIEVFQRYLNDIDNYCSLLLKFIAVSNPSDYYSYIHNQIFHYAVDGQIVPQHKLVKYSPLIEFMFFDEVVGEGIADMMAKFLPYVKSNTWKQLILVFYANAIKDQCFSRPEDYNYIVQPGTEIEATCRVMFDYVNTVFENNQSVGASSMVQAWLACLCLSDIIEISNKPNKLKMTFNKRLKFLHQILRDSQNSPGLESFDSLINIYYLAARLPKLYHSHPVVLFCMEYFDSTFEALHKLSLYYSNRDEESSSLYDNLVINYNVVAVMVCPEKYIQILTNRYYQSLGNIKEMRILVKVVKGLSELKKSQIEFDKVMIKLKGSLKHMIVGAVKILHQLDIGNKNSQLIHQLYNNLLLHPLDNQSLRLIDSCNSRHLSPVNQQVNRSSLESAYSRKDSLDVLSPTPSAKQFLVESATRSETDESAISLPTTQTPIPNPLTHTLTNASTSSSSTSSSTNKIFESTEEILSELFYIFISVPETYFIDIEYLNRNHLTDLPLDTDTILISEFNRIRKFCIEVTKPLKYTFQSNVASDALIDAACSLSMSLVSNRFANEDNPKVLLSNYLTLNYIIHFISDSCLSLPLTDAKFKSLFLFLNRFLEFRYRIVENNMLDVILSKLNTENRAEVVTLYSHSLEKLLLISICTHDVQFFDVAKSTMKWYIKEVFSLQYSLLDNVKEDLFNRDLFNRFVTIMNDNSLFTGFVSLHKKFHAILRDVTASQSIFEVWLIILNRWLDILGNERSKAYAEIENVTFRHYTGFLICLSASFMQDSFYKDDFIQKHKIMESINQFFERSILLLTTEDLVVRVIIKDALSNESHAVVYHMICNKMVEIIKQYIDAARYDNEESILFIEQVLTVMTLMVNSKGNGSMVLVAILPDICELIIKFVSKVQDILATFRLKIRFCKLGVSIESDKVTTGVRAAYRIRNGIARAKLEWLQQAVFFEEERALIHPQPQKHSNASIITSSSINSASVETLYLSIDLANEASKALALILEDLILEIPDGTRDKDIKKAKDIIFATYFSTLYKILQKYTYADSTTMKLKYKVHLIVENVLKCISNILKTETDIGMQFVLPLAFHENKRIRSIFLDVFANIFSQRKYNDHKVEFPPGIIERFTKFDDICGIAAKKASTSEHNLLASALFTVFGHSNKLDKLFHALLVDEVSTVSRTTDIFRRNSPLTRILSNFTKEYGAEYLVKTLRPFVEKLNNNGVYFEVEKELQTLELESGHDVDADSFMIYLRELVRTITSSTIDAPKSFKFICREIYTCVRVKGDNVDALIAVGSYIFLRFFCPAIISPEAFLNIPLANIKAKRTLMQLVKVIQNIVNGSLAVKWPRLQSKLDELETLNKEIFKFLKDMSCEEQTGDVFQRITESPIPEMRYLHKFVYYYFGDIKCTYVLSDSLVATDKLQRRIDRFCEMDGIMQELGQPKSLLALQLNATLKTTDNDPSIDPRFTDFMGKMALRYAEVSPDMPLVHTTIFDDGTPTIVCNLELLKSQLNNDVELLVYRMFEFCMQVWDNTFYIVYDFTESEIDVEFGERYMWLMQYYAPDQFMKTCARFYYFNIPIFKRYACLNTMNFFREEGRSSSSVKCYSCSLDSKSDFVGRLSLSSRTMASIQDVRVGFHDVLLFDFEAGKFIKVSMKIGRKWIQICSEDIFPVDESICETKYMQPTLVKRLKEVTKCEIVPMDGGSGSLDSAADCQFILQFNNDEQLILKSPKRLEIVRFLYFATSGLPASNSLEDDTAKQISGGINEKASNENGTLNTVINQKELIPYLWFLRLYNAVFQGLLCDEKEVRSSAALLFAGLSSYFEMEMGISVEHAKSIAFPANTTDFIVATSKYLSKQKPELSYRFFKAFFDYYEKLPHSHRVLALMYISPWIDNVCDYIYLSTNDGNEASRGASRTIDIIRLFCKISSDDKSHIAYINDYIWKKLFGDFRLTTILVDEVVAYALDSINEGPDWSFIIAVVTPTIEVCGEIVTRLTTAIAETSVESTLVAKQTKLIEIQVLIKICSVIFFDLYYFAQMFLADVFFFCSLFINHSAINDVGEDLQKLVSNVVQSYLHKPNMNVHERKIINDTLSYVTGQRAHLLFHGNRVQASSLMVDAPHIYHRATSFEILCDHLLMFLSEMGSSTGLVAKWRAKWCTNAIEVAFNKKSVFQSRAILLAGILCKSGVGDSLASRIFKITSHQNVTSVSYLTSQVVSCSRVVEGLSTDSVIPKNIFWPALCLSLLDNIVIYQPTLHLFLNICSKLVEHNMTDLDREKGENLGLIGEIFESKKTMEPYVSDYEKEYSFHFEPENIAIYVCFAFLKGLKSSHIKQTSISCMMKFVKYRLKKNVPILSAAVLPYMSFIYLSSTEVQFKSFLSEIGHEELFDKKSSTTNNPPPQFILNFFLSGNNTTKAYLIQAANLYKTESVDTTFKMNFLNLYKELLFLKRELVISYSIWLRLN